MLECYITTVTKRLVRMFAEPRHNENSYGISEYNFAYYTQLNTFLILAIRNIYTKFTESKILYNSCIPN